MQCIAQVLLYYNFVLLGSSDAHLLCHVPYLVVFKVGVNVLLPPISFSSRSDVDVEHPEHNLDSIMYVNRIPTCK